MELICKNIHMNRQKGKAVNQITLDDDYNIPESMPDVSMIIQEKGRIEIGEAKAEAGRIRVKGMLEFGILYVDDLPEHGLHSIKGQIPFEEFMNVDEAQDGDHLQLNWMLEDLSAALINSRKLSIKTILTLELTVSALYDEEVLVGAEGDEGIQMRTCPLSVTGLTAQKKDICRIKDEWILPANKPNIREVLWQDITMQGTELRLADDEVLVKGEFVVFVLYEGEEERGKAFWLEQVLPFHSHVDVSGCREGMPARIGLSLTQSDLEVKPDYDGELRVFNLDAVLELDIQLYEEKQLDAVCDLYHPGKKLELFTRPAVYESLLICNSSKCRVTGRVKAGRQELQMLQICHSKGEIKIDETLLTEEGIVVEGIVSVQVLCITSEDSMPFLCLKEAIPFEYLIAVPGIQTDSVYELQTSLEQLTVNMVNSEELEMKAGILLHAMIFNKACVQHISGVVERPLDLEEIRALPGFLVYVVQPGDTLWELAKANYTTVEQIMAWNDLAGTDLKPGQKLLFVKQMEQL